MVQHRSLLLLAALAATAPLVSPAYAACTLPVPTDCAKAVNGSAFTITNTENSQGHGHPTPFAITGVGTGTMAGGVEGKATNAGGMGLYGESTKANSYAVFGFNAAGGFGGYFALDGPRTTNLDSALEADNTGGSATLPGFYGSAGIFKVTNQKNTSPALNVVNINGDGIDARSTSGIAVSAISTKSYAVSATSTQSDGVSANSTYGNGVSAFSSSGTGVSGISTSGYAAQFSVGPAECYFNGGTNWTCGSDRNIKEDFRTVDGKDMLRRLADMPVLNFKMKGQRDPELRWIGPTAQDFKAAFGLGEDDRHINTGNEMGVALAAIQGLYAELQDRDAKIAAQDARIAAMQDQLAEQKAAIAAMQEAVAHLVKGADGSREAKISQP